jgi:hypothetical protein
MLPGMNEYNELFPRFAGAKYELSFDEAELLSRVRAALPAWRAARDAPPGVPSDLKPRQCSSYYTHLATTSRLGDRMLDVWTAMTLSRLANPAASCVIQMLPTSYDLTAVQFGERQRCSVSQSAKKSPPQAQPGEVVCSLTAPLMSMPSVPMVSGNPAAEAARNCGACGGSSTPARLLQLPQIASQLPPETRTVDELSAAFSRVAMETRLVPGSARAEKVAAFKREHPLGVSGLHVRRSDKVKPVSRSAWDDILVMTPAQADAYLDAAIEYLSSLPKPRLTYLATDEPAKFAGLQRRLRAAGLTVVNDQPQEDAWVDLFSLAECDRVVMAARYSTFSLVASMLRHKPLVSFSERNASLLQIWEGLTVQWDVHPKHITEQESPFRSKLRWNEVRWPAGKATGIAATADVAGWATRRPRLPPANEAVDEA